jgi:hypothetical protein
LQQLIVLVGLVEDFDRRIEAEPLLTAHQRFIAEGDAGAGFDDRLEGVFDNELGEGYDLIAGVATDERRFDGGSQRHAVLHCDNCFVVFRREAIEQASTKTFPSVKVL